LPIRFAVSSHFLRARFRSSSSEFQDARGSVDGRGAVAVPLLAEANDEHHSLSPMAAAISRPSKRPGAKLPVYG
jgi:hypothetical protein